MKKLKTQNSKLKTGFTLIELMVVVSVLVIAGGIALGTLFSALRGATKSQSVTSVRQNGNSAISQMTKMLRDAKRFEGVSIDGTNYVTSCAVSGYKAIKITNFDNGITTFKCDTSTISSNSASLLDTSSVTLASCQFTCNQSSVIDTPHIGIIFSLSNFAPTGMIPLFENTASASAVTFQTSVVLRNIGR